MTQENSSIICFFHKSCIDGTTSAAVLKDALKDQNIIFIPLKHGANMPELLEKYLNDNISQIIFLDIAPKEEDLIYLRNLRQEKQGYKEVIIIDHHKTSLNIIAKFIGQELDENKPINITYDFLKFIYDPNESGASLTYKTFFNKEEIPLLIDIVKDKDIWLWRYENTDEVNDFLSIYIDNPDMVLSFLHQDIKDIASKSKILSEYKRSIVSRLKDSWTKTPMFLNINDRKIPCINTPIYQSELGAELAKEYGIACLFYLTGDMVKLSFRSTDNSARAIAESLGGGGHDNASGAIIDKDTFFNSLSTGEPHG